MRTAEPELSALRQVTANFTSWQGLRWVPVGLALLVVAWAGTPRFPLGERWRGWTWSTAMLAGLALSELAGRYYDNAYGRVRPLRGFYERPDARRWYVIFPILGAGLLLDLTLAPPVTLSGPVLGVAVEGFRRSTGGGRRHYLLGSAALIALGPLPLLGVLRPGSAALHAATVVLGGVFIAGGLLDHLALRHLLPPVLTEDGSACSEQRAPERADTGPTPGGDDGRTL
jgi:hypothetical protein